ncbi:hypothetical protein INT45_001847 [Circinella minor]|uniref:Uncharacterized protein n=1 Tax=Circinella minor TaxID=1195481 RepID=A0A8H7RUM2_9FUNG|nr:hypothetical protein INT45_001847 [Circinella minor]
MSTPDETKGRRKVKRSITKRAGSKVRHLLQRARGKKDHHNSSSADDDENGSHMNTSTSNLSQHSSSGGSLTTEGTDDDELHDTTRNNTKDSKFSLASSGGSGSAKPEKTADRFITTPHDGYRSRKTSTASSYEKYDRQRVSLDNSSTGNKIISMDHRKRATSSPKPIAPSSDVVSSNKNKQSSSIIVVPAAATVLSPPESPISPSTPKRTSGHSVTSQSVEDLSVGSSSISSLPSNDKESSIVLVPPNKNNNEIIQEKNNVEAKSLKEEKNMTKEKKEKKIETVPYNINDNKEVLQQQQQQENGKESIILVDENSYVLPSTKKSTPASTNTTTPTTFDNNAAVDVNSSNKETNTDDTNETTTTTTTTTNKKSNDSSSISTSTELIVIGKEEVFKRVAYFDKKHRGKITMLDTFASLRGLGYNWIFAIPATFIMHLRLSPLTVSPHQSYSLRDWFSWPIYTERVAQALVNHTPWIHRRDQVNKWIDSYGHNKGSVRGLTFWDGFRVLRGAERTTLRWWQFRLWLVHRLQWILTYSILHDPQTRMVTQPALEYLCPSPSST